MFYNIHTGVSEKLPTGWVLSTDETGNAYYYNTETGSL